MISFVVTLAVRSSFEISEESGMLWLFRAASG